MFILSFICSSKNTFARTIGLEIDLIPYLTGAYSAAFTLGSGSLRIKPVFARMKAPAYMIGGGGFNSEFNSLNIKSFSVFMDCFLFKIPNAINFDGFFVSTGFGYWNNSIERNGYHDPQHFRTIMLTLGVGYIIPLYKSFYMAPWGALNFKANGAAVSVYGASYKPKRVIPEFSMKFGFEL